MKPEIGQTATIEKTLDKQTVEAFASVSEDNNPIHLDEDFAKTTQFERPIVHGMLASSLISGLLASKVPGAGSIYLGQILEVCSPYLCRRNRHRQGRSH